MNLSAKATIAILSICTLAAQTYVLDTSFNPQISGPVGNTLSVNAIALQEDGKLVIAGAFSQAGGLSRSCIARLNEDGSGDESFDPGTGADLDINAVLLQPDGKVLVGGRFNVLSDVSMPGLGRLNADGTFDWSWTAYLSTLANALSAQRLAFDSEGNVIVGGFFTHVSGTRRICLAKISSESVVSSYDPGLNNGVLALHNDEENRLLIGGGFTSVGGTPQPRVSRILPNGSVDSTFNTGSGPDYFVYVLANGGDGRLLMGGAFTNVNGITQRGLARLESSGGMDLSFRPQFSGPYVLVFNALMMPEKKMMVAGYWTHVDGKERPALVRLQPDGSVDESFDLGMIDDGVSQVVRDSKGNLYVAGFFSQIAGQNRDVLVRLKLSAPPAPEIERIRREGSAVIVSIMTEAGVKYALQRRSEVQSGQWTTVQSMDASGEMQDFEAVEASGDAAFFRVTAE